MHSLCFTCCLTPEIWECIKYICFRVQKTHKCRRSLLPASLKHKVKKISVLNDILINGANRRQKFYELLRHWNQSWADCCKSHENNCCAIQSKQCRSIWGQKIFFLAVNHPFFPIFAFFPFFFLSFKTKSPYSGIDQLLNSHSLVRRTNFSQRCTILEKISKTF